MARQVPARSLWRPFVWRHLLAGCAALSPCLLGPAQALTSEPAATSAPSSPPVQGAVPLGLGDLEEIALQRNPTLAQAAAAVDASRGKALQAGLCPNPTIGYRGDNIGIAGSAGEFQGGFVQQTIVTAGKLRLS
ncbi:MAG TPA: hypothetical protein VGY58_03440, partial [Gemmataceae bacterium]|nr:hypothetical protein [Gemmataceae bacterium]